MTDTRTPADPNPAMDPEPVQPRDFIGEARQILGSAGRFITQREHLLALAADANRQHDKQERTVKFYGDVLAAVMADSVGAARMQMPLEFFQRIVAAEASIVPEITESSDPDKATLTVTVVFRKPDGIADVLAMIGPTPARQM